EPVRLLPTRVGNHPDQGGAPPHRGGSLAFVLKVASRCNLNCAYCYVYNKGDETWRDRPVVMSDDVVEAAIDRIDAWCRGSGQTRVNVTFHGGEPLLAGRRRFDRWCR